MRRSAPTSVAIGTKLDDGASVTMNNADGSDASLTVTLKAYEPKIVELN